MHKQELLSRFFEVLCKDKDIEKIKVKYKNGELLKISFDCDNDNDDEVKNVAELKVDNYGYNHDNNDKDYDDELEDESTFEFDKDGYDEYIDDDEDK